MSTISGIRLIEAHECLMRIYWLPGGTPVPGELQHKCMEVAAAIKIAVGLTQVNIAPETDVEREPA